MSRWVHYFEVQKKIHGWLSAAGVQVIDFATHETNTPWAAFINLNQTAARSKSNYPVGWTMSVQMQVVTSYEGKKEAADISETICETLDARITEDEKYYSFDLINTAFLTVEDESDKRVYNSVTIDFQFNINP